MSTQLNAGRRTPANWLTDDPIDDLSQDALGRGPFVRRVVSVLDETVELSTSTVVGLTGPWGSGKSSSARLVLAALDRSRLTVREVNPWGVSGPAALTAEILGAIGSAFPERRTRKL